MAKKSIMSLFVKHVASSFPTLDGTKVLKVTRVGGAFRIQVLDEYTDSQITEYYIGEPVADDLKNNRIIIIQKDNLKLKTIWKGCSFEDGFGFLGKKYGVNMDPSYFIKMAASV